MFSLRLLATHCSGETYEMNLYSLPSVSELIEGMQGYLEEKFDLKFSELPPMFKACDDPPIATVVHPLAQAPLPKAALQPKNVRASIHNCSSVL